MTDWKKVGNNIRSLRLAYGETQEQLAAAIIENGKEKAKNTISSYENGERHPKESTLELIAKHYLISVAELKSCDFSSIERVSVDISAYLKNVRVVFPIVFSQRALDNSQFKKAYESHSEFFNELHRMRTDVALHKAGECVDDYIKVLDNDESIVEAAANLLGVLYFMLGEMIMNPLLINSKPAVLKQIASNEHRFKKMLDDADGLAETELIKNEIMDDELKEGITELISVVKHTDRLSDLADYYIALQYLLNLADNDLEYEVNRRIGTEMMVAFFKVDNPYVKRYLRFGLESIEYKSSRFVDDK